MKKHLYPLSFTLFILLHFFYTTAGSAQAKTNETTKSQGNQIVISISGIEYDDAGFLLLKENLKTNQKVKSINLSYAGQTANLDFMYTGTAFDLWDEMPGKTKEFFKVTSIENNRITLVKKTVSTGPGELNSPGNTNDTACNCCTYFPLCRYDNTRTFQGVVYKGITFDNGTFYYYCNNGVVTQKQVTLNGNEVTSAYTQTILKCNARVGTTWTETDDNGATNQHTIVSKGVTMQVNGKTYNDVMQVYHKTYSGISVTFSHNNYYANGIGLIKDEAADADYDPNKAFAAKKTADSVLATLPGKIDQSIVGTWAYYDSVMNWKLYYRFNSDGTWEYYAGSISPANQMFTFDKTYWHVNGDHLELWYGGWNPQHISQGLQKKNDPATGKPTLIIQFKGTETSTYFSQDGKSAW